MFNAYIIVTAAAAAANIYAAMNDFTRPAWLLANMRKLGVPESSLPILGVLKAAGALGLLIGIRMPMIGIAAAVGLTSLPTRMAAIPRRCNSDTTKRLV